MLWLSVWHWALHFTYQLIKYSGVPFWKEETEVGQSWRSCPRTLALKEGLGCNSGLPTCKSCISTGIIIWRGHQTGRVPAQLHIYLLFLHSWALMSVCKSLYFIVEAKSGNPGETDSKVTHRNGELMVRSCVRKLCCCWSVSDSFVDIPWKKEMVTHQYYLENSMDKPGALWAWSTQVAKELNNWVTSTHHRCRNLGLIVQGHTVSWNRNKIQILIESLFWSSL